MDNELIQYIDATDNMQMEYLKNKTSPDFIKLCNPEWNEDITEEEGFIHALKLADEFWDLYIKHAVAEIEAIEIIIKKTNETNENYAIFDKELPYRKAINLLENKNMKYLIFKSKRECYDIRIIDTKLKFKKKIVIEDIEQARKISNIKDLLYVDTHGKLCCTKTLESAINLVKYNEILYYLLFGHSLLHRKLCYHNRIWKTKFQKLWAFGCKRRLIPLKPHINLTQISHKLRPSPWMSENNTDS